MSYLGCQAYVIMSYVGSTTRSRPIMSCFGWFADKNQDKVVLVLPGPKVCLYDCVVWCLTLVYRQQCSNKCANNNPYCTAWAGRRECEKNPEYMDIYCKKVIYRPLFKSSLGILVAGINSNSNLFNFPSEKMFTIYCIAGL